MKVTKREILASLTIICIMIGLGVLISRPIINNASEKALKISEAVQIRDSSMFDYCKRTNVGYFLAQGTLSVADSVSIPDIKGYYAKIEKIKEEYREHTRTVTETDDEGNTHTYTETYWEWDRVDSWEWNAKQVKFLGIVFNPKSIGYRYHTQYKETIVPKVSFFDTKIRYKYYTCPTRTWGLLEGEVIDKTYKNIQFYEHKDIETTVDQAQSNVTSVPITFWILWSLITGCLVFFFFYAENKWLY